MSSSSEVWQEKLWILTKAVLRNIPGMSLPVEIFQILEEIDKADQESKRNDLLNKLKERLSSIEITEIEFIECADYKATLRYEPSTKDNILLLPIGGPAQRPGVDFSVSGRELYLNRENEPAFVENEKIIIVYNRFFQIDDR